MFGDRDPCSPNGIHGRSGEPLLRLSSDQLGASILAEGLDPQQRGELEAVRDRAREKSLALRFGLDPRHLEQAGWGIVLPEAGGEAIRGALRPLLEHRREAAGAFYREFSYRKGDSKQQFLARHGVGPGPANPEKVPYYLLLAADPEEIPWEFQHQLGVQYAVGRLAFETHEEYAHYGEGVLAVEAGDVGRPKKAAIFATAHGGDRATRRSLEELAIPLAHWMDRSFGDWESSDRLFVDRATKENLLARLGGGETPSLLFTATHGVGFDDGDPLQLRHQGALLCQDWEKTRTARQRPEHYVSADDVSDGVDLRGLIAFHFACFGAGTPRYDRFASGKVRRLAPRSFLARLPQRLLGHPGGGALAVIGHVDRAWSYTFKWSRRGQQLETFEDTFTRLAAGIPLGAAMEAFSQRYAELAADLSAGIDNVKYGGMPDYLDLAGLWAACNDARSYVILGDPAVSLPSRAAE